MTGALPAGHAASYGQCTASLHHGRGRWSAPHLRAAAVKEESDVHQRVENLRRWLRTYARAEQRGLAGPLSEGVLSQLEQAIESLTASDEDLRFHLDTARLTAAHLEDERNRYRELLDLAPDAYLLTDLEGTILEANAAAHDLFGRQRSAVTGRPLSLFVVAEDKPVLWEWLGELQASELVLQWELRVQAAGGVERHVVVRARRASTRAELRWMLRDVTERIRAEETERRLHRERAERQAAEAAARHARFLARAGRILNASSGTAAVCEAIVESAVPTLGAVAVLDVERAGQPVRVVAPAGELSGRVSEPGLRAPQTPIGRVFATGELEVLPSLDDGLREQLAPAAADVFAELNLTAAVLVPLSGKDATAGVLTLLGTTLEDCCAHDLLLGKAFGEAAALALENARLLEEAQAASHSKSDFISFMSHEFRTPLTSIVGYADLLDTETGGPLTEIQRRQLNRLRAGAWHLSRLVDEILYFSRETSSSPALELADVDVRQLAVECVQGLRPTAVERGLSLTLHAPAEPLRLRTDAGRIRQILLNLIGNALKFTDEGGVQVELRATGDGLEITIRDTGIGIPPDQLDSVFAPFRQAHGERGGGTGLGLAIARQLARRLGGEVTVSSSVGDGSVFTVRLPADVTAA